ncbi:Dot/Icm secretion system substrate [Legionella steigerwaltii]|uniref:Dot/Icm T4SS effector n=1 Tax=Legionella steigerwaltii TaxID=460 RepID=A0A378LFA6_9GAMM|nr:hypothetical protein [Legionella steigerwaltii]KTD77819.1 Dot/Icm T4SS effector [Legionella steigerwaltii]STY24459.1 Dot/Icm secretion system substrate [Legionella steigerwaltii]
MTIRYISFGIDGGLFNKNYLNADHENFAKHLGNAVLVHNKAFLDTLKEQNKHFDSVYAFLYSNRQSYEVDLTNVGTHNRFKGSAFSTIETVCQDLGIVFDPFLLADLYNQLPYGTAFNKAIAEVKNGNYIDNPDNEGHPTCPFDQDKTALLFAQLQKAAVDAATQHPGEDIVFDVFDAHQPNLEYTKRFFSENKHLIPKGVTLNLNHYDGGEPTLCSSIDGEGVVYFNFAKHTIKLLEKGFSEREEYAKLSIHPENPKTLMDFVAQYFARHPDLFQEERVPTEVTERVQLTCRELGLDETALKGSHAPSDAGSAAQEGEKEVEKAGDSQHALPAGESMTVNSQTSPSNPGLSQHGFYAADDKEGQEKAEPSTKKPSPMRSCTLF